MKKHLITYFFLIAFALTSNAQLKKTNYISKSTFTSNDEKNERVETKENVYITFNDPEGIITINFIDKAENSKMTFTVYNKQILKEGKMHYYTLRENKWNIAYVSIFFINSETSIMLSYPEPDKNSIYFSSVKKQ